MNDQEARNKFKAQIETARGNLRSKVAKAFAPILARGCSAEELADIFIDVYQESTEEFLSFCNRLVPACERLEELGFTKRQVYTFITLIMMISDGKELTLSNLSKEFSSQGLNFRLAPQVTLDFPHWEIVPQPTFWQRIGVWLGMKI